MMKNKRTNFTSSWNASQVRPHADMRWEEHRLLSGVPMEECWDPDSLSATATQGPRLTEVPHSSWSAVGSSGWWHLVPVTQTPVPSVSETSNDQKREGIINEIRSLSLLEL